VTPPQRASLSEPLRPRRSAPEPEPATDALTGVEEIAPVDRQADPSHWLPARALLIVGVVALLALIATVVVCVIIWTTAPMHPLHIPTVPRG
jgi:hypothetical protein